jgi:hypothetical protein
MRLVALVYLIYQCHAISFVSDEMHLGQSHVIQFFLMCLIGRFDQMDEYVKKSTYA